MSEQIIEVLKVKYSNRKSHLLFTQSKMILTDLYPEWTMPDSSMKADALWAVPVVGDYLAIKDLKRLIKESRVDTEEKKKLREAFEAYRKSQDKTTLELPSLEQVLQADPRIEFLQRIIPYSSITKVDVKKPSRLKNGKIVITQEISRKSASGRKYTRQLTREFNILEDKKHFPTILENLQQLIQTKISV